MMTEGIQLMIIGMGVVFSFLILLVLAMQASAAFFKKFGHLFPEEITAAKPTKKVQDLSDVAVAIAAVKAHCAD